MWDVEVTDESLTNRRTRDRGRINSGHKRGAGHTRPFCVWDGEGAEMGDGNPQAYCILGNSEGGLIRAEDYQYLTTDQCLEFLIAEKEKYPEHIHVGFAIGYDMEMFCRNIPFAELQKKNKNPIRYKKWRIEVRHRKFIMITDTETKTTIQIYDIFSFWNTSAIKALKADPRIGPNDPRVKFIEAGKNDRGTFQYSEIDTKVLPYMKVELELYRDLISNLRDNLVELDLVPPAWYGPSAIVSMLYRRAGLKKYMARPKGDLYRYRRKKHGLIQKPSSEYSYSIPDSVNRAALAAYSGGRFEQFKVGLHSAKAYEYDINSAYPYAMTFLPQLSEGRWAHYDKDELDKLRKTQRLPPGNAQFGFYKIWYEFENDTEAVILSKATGTLPPHPFSHRAEDGTVSYPREYFGWQAYWTAKEAWSQIPSAIFVEAHVWEPANDFKPFADANCIDINDLYTRRNHYASIGRPDLKYVLKILLNSGYGKLAQQVGTDWGDNLPPFHQMEWAAHITDYCRARMWRYARDAWANGSLIALETDAIITSRPIKSCERHRDDTALGGLKRIDFDGIAYLQSGVYFSLEAGSWTFHCRGLDRNTWNITDIESYFATVDYKEMVWPALRGATTLFYTANLSGVRFGHVVDFYNKWLRWVKVTKDVVISHPRFKRYHNPQFCRACKNGEPPNRTMHDLSSKSPKQMESTTRKAPWLNRIDSKSKEQTVVELWRMAEVVTDGR